MTLIPHSQGCFAGATRGTSGQRNTFRCLRQEYAVKLGDGDFFSVDHFAWISPLNLEKHVPRANKLTKHKLRL
jgi:hypothetical protein